MNANSVIVDRFGEVIQLAGIATAALDGSFRVHSNASTRACGLRAVHWAHCGRHCAKVRSRVRL